MSFISQPVLPVQLRNRVILITEPVASGKTAAIGFWFYTGSRSEPDTLRGITHFVEHMLFKGTGKRSSFDIACAFDRMGGYINAYTERENVCLYCVVPSVRVDAALEIMCDMISNAVLDEKERLHELKVIESEIISAGDDPEEAALDAVGESVWPAQKISLSISGTVRDVGNLTRNDLFEWYTKYFVHGELTVCITGNYNRDAVIGRLEQLPDHTFQLQPFHACHFKDQVPVWKPGINFISAPFRQEQFFLLFPLDYPVDEKTYYSLCVLNALTGDTMSSRLFQRLREKGGYCYNVYSFFSFYEDTGCWCAYASSARRSSLRIVSDINSEMKNLLSCIISDEELDAAREHLCGEELIAADDIEYRMKRLERNYSAGYLLRTTEETIDGLRSVTKDDIIRCIKLLLRPEKAAFVVYGPKLPEKERNKIGMLFPELNGEIYAEFDNNTMQSVKRGKAAHIQN